MASRRPTFRQADISRALKGAIAAGMKPTSAEISSEGRIVLSFAEANPVEPASAFDGLEGEAQCACALRA